MAKPTGWPFYSTRPNTGNQALYQVSTSRTRRRWRLSGRAPGPSSGVLSLLATIAAATSSADGSPLVVPFTPPSFLCPFIEHESCHAHTDIPSDIGTAKRATRKARKVVQIADKFEEGPDGRWRKVDTYTLYGSTVCQKNCPPSSTPGDVNNVIDPTLSPTPPQMPQPGDKYTAAMPTGWSTSANYNKHRTTVILCVSLILAFFMCAFMVAFVIWRRRQKKPIGDDEEMKLRRRRGQDLSEQEALMKMEARLKQKIWARASARWKANTQSSARRRKNRRLLAAVQSMSASLHDNSCPESSLRAPSRPSSTCTSSTPTPRSSSSSDDGTTHGDGHTTLGLSISTPSLDPVAPASPPAYIQSNSLPPIQSKRNRVDETYIHTDHDPPDPFSPISCNDNDHDGRPRYTSSADEVPIPYDDPYHAGHVATDDKTRLARMVEMASAPPENPDQGGLSTLQTSVPVWDDEDVLDGIEIGPSDTSPLPSLPPSSHTMFPPPPSKGEMVALDFNDYPYSFEADISALEPELGPSAPPFEECTPSAPHLEELEIMPCAPPLMEGFLLSTPDWEGVEGGQNHDREVESLQQHLSRCPSLSATDDGILPSYRA